MTKKFDKIYESVVNEDIILEGKLNDLFSKIVNKIIKKVKQDKINIQGKPLSIESKKVLSNYIKMKASDNFTELMKSKPGLKIDSLEKDKIINKVHHIKTQTVKDLKKSGYKNMSETQKFIELDSETERDIDEIIQDDISKWEDVNGVLVFKR